MAISKEWIIKVDTIEELLYEKYSGKYLTSNNAFWLWTCENNLPGPTSWSLEELDELIKKLKE